ncbi:MAG: chromate efflux transporter [Planctomycetes bacterium]|nr:chromate efflux transporter [Planctomycetota bacterium]
MKMKNASEVFRVFFRLGCLSFGGPVAHLGYFQEEFVARRQWIGASRFADLVALAQFLPGPSSSQVGFAIGLERAGLFGGIAAWTGFTLPSAVAMYLAAMAVLSPGGLSGSGWLQGLKTAAVSVVALAALQMLAMLAPDRNRRILALATFVLSFSFNHVLPQGVVLVVGAMAGLLGLCGRDDSSAERAHTRSPVTGRIGLLALLGFAASLLVVWKPWMLFAQAGALVFGGGHVVLPLLENRFILAGLTDPNTFLAGYGVAQAMPGPLFTFATFLGATSALDLSPPLGALVATIAIFAPGILLMTAALPFWDGLKNRAWARGMLSGVNAAVVGLLFAALALSLAPALLIRKEGSILAWSSTAMALIGLAAFEALRRRLLPVPVVVALCAMAGWLLA